MQIETQSREETIEAGKNLAKRLKPGDILAFRGGMGAGKTTFTIGLAEGLGCPGWVSSPTFALVQEYGGKIPLCHFDMFRIKTMDDLYSTGFFDYLDAGGICIAEWCENITNFIPDGAVKVSISKLSDSPDTRRISIE